MKMVQLTDTTEDGTHKPGALFEVRTGTAIGVPPDQMKSSTPQEVERGVMLPPGCRPGV